MSQALNEIQELFSNSDIDPVELNDLLVFLPILPEDVLQKLAECFKEDPKLIKEFVDNFKSRFETLSGQKGPSWDDIENDGEDFDQEDKNIDKLDEEENF
ncbi:MAG: hypothetical protein WCX88_04345 [Patescibacteria group bacterium]